jgi:hypothetical protein
MKLKGQTQSAPAPSQTQDFAVISRGSQALSDAMMRQQNNINNYNYNQDLANKLQSFDTAFLHSMKDSKELGNKIASTPKASNSDTCLLTFTEFRGAIKTQSQAINSTVTSFHERYCLNRRRKGQTAAHI